MPTLSRERLAWRLLPSLPMITTSNDVLEPSLDPAFVSFTQEFVDDLRAVREVVNEPRTNAIGVGIRSTAARLYPSFEAFLDDRLLELEEQIGRIPEAVRAVHARHFRSKMRPLTRESRFLARTNDRPRGYAGDSEMMRMLYDDDFCGATVFSCLLHRHPLQSAAAKAVRYRVGLVAEAVAARRSVERPVRVMSLACGPAREIRNIFTTPSDVHGVELVIADQDRAALDEAAAEIRHVEDKLGVALPVERRQLSVRDVLTNKRGTRVGGGVVGEENAPLKDLDLIYSLGLFDYLSRSVAKKLVSDLVTMLRPGGALVVGNFHVSCKTRVYLDTWMDWPLLYRTESELLELGDDVACRARRIERDPTGSQMFLFLTKEA